MKLKTIITLCLGLSLLLLSVSIVNATEYLDDFNRDYSQNITDNSPAFVTWYDIPLNNPVSYTEHDKVEIVSNKLSISEHDGTYGAISAIGEFDDLSLSEFDDGNITYEWDFTFSDSNRVASYMGFGEDFQEAESFYYAGNSNYDSFIPMSYSTYTPNSPVKPYIMVLYNTQYTLDYLDILGCGNGTTYKHFWADYTGIHNLTLAFDVENREAKVWIDYNLINTFTDCKGKYDLYNGNATKINSVSFSTLENSASIYNLIIDDFAINYNLETSIELFTNLTNTTDYTFNNIDLNFTGVFTGTPINETMLLNIYINDVLHDNESFSNISQNNFYSINLTGTEIPIEVNVTIINDLYEDSLIYVYGIDNLQPRLNTSPIINDDLFLRDSTKSQYFSFYDYNLFATNITLYHNEMDLVLFNNFTTNISTDTFILNHTYLYAITGNYTYNINAWDSHTKQKIKDFKQDLTEDSITFDNQIKITSIDFDDKKTKEEKIKTIKKNDRYNFEFSFKKNQKSKSLVVESEDLVYLPNSKYKGHFVDLKNKKWIDFESDKIKNVKIKKLKNNQFEITFDSDEDIILFKSIGTLNELSQTINFEVYEIPEVNITATTTAEAIETAGENIKSGFEMGALFILFLFSAIIYIVKTDDDLIDMFNAVISVVLVIGFSMIDKSLYAYLSIGLSILLFVRIYSRGTE